MSVKGAYNPNRPPKTGKTEGVKFKPPTRGDTSIAVRAIDAFEVIEKRIHTL